MGLVHPRSGLAARLGVTVLNAPGTVDAGYRGEIMVILVNHDRTSSVKIARGDRIAQLVVQRVERAEFQPVEELPASRRGRGRARVHRWPRQPGIATLPGNQARPDRPRTRPGMPPAMSGLASNTMPAWYRRAGTGPGVQAWKGRPGPTHRCRT